MVDPKKLERKVINKLGGRSTPASGARPGQKADGHINFKYRIEHKSTKKGSYPLNQKLLRKLEVDSKSSQGEPVLVITFPRSKSLVLLPEHICEEVEVSREEQLPLQIDPYDYNIRVTHPTLAYSYVTLSLEKAKDLIGI